MSWLKLGWNSEGVGWRTVEIEMPRVPAVGEFIEFWHPDGSASGIDPELDGMAYVVVDVTWVCFDQRQLCQESGKTAQAIVHMEPK